MLSRICFFAWGVSCVVVAALVPIAIATQDRQILLGLIPAGMAIIVAWDCGVEKLGFDKASDVLELPDEPWDGGSL